MRLIPIDRSDMTETFIHKPGERTLLVAANTEQETHGADVTVVVPDNWFHQAPADAIVRRVEDDAIAVVYIERTALDDAAHVVEALHREDVRAYLVND